MKNWIFGQTADIPHGLSNCEWTRQEGFLSYRKSIADLIEKKANKLVPNREKMESLLPRFLVGGWTSGAADYQDQINQQPVAGSNWVSAGMRLVEPRSIGSVSGTVDAINATRHL